MTRVPMLLFAAVAGAVCTLGCDAAVTTVVLENQYPASSANVIYQAFWQSVPFTTPIAPGASSDPQSTPSASDNTAYVLLAPGWNTASTTPPTSLIVLQSKSGFAVHLNTTLHIPVDDATFDGNCAAGSRLTQATADFITQQVFASRFASLSYDAATCETSNR